MPKCSRIFEDLKKYVGITGSAVAAHREGPHVESHLAPDPQVTLGQTALMLIVLAVVLVILRASTSPHDFMGAETVCYGFVIGWFAGWMAKRRQMSL